MNSAHKTNVDLSSSANNAALVEHFSVDRSSDSFSVAFDMEDLIFDAEFTSLHNTILGKLSVDLYLEMENHPDLIDKADAFGRSPLYWAIMTGNIYAVEVLLSHNADISSTTGDGQTVFHECALAPLKIIQPLLPPKNDLTATAISLRCMHMNKRNNYGYTPWQIAIDWGKSDALQTFVAWDCDFTMQNLHGRTALHLAMLFGTWKIAAALSVPEFESIDPDVRDIYGVTARSLFLSRFTSGMVGNDNVNDESLPNIREYGSSDEVALWSLLQCANGLRRKGRDSMFSQGGLDIELAIPGAFGVG